MVYRPNILDAVFWQLKGRTLYSIADIQIKGMAGFVLFVAAIPGYVYKTADS
jgi:hypothetical protein